VLHKIGHRRKQWGDAAGLHEQHLVLSWKARGEG
jgi:hypothetical protein